MPRIDPTAEVSADAEIGDGTVVWGLAQVREGAVLGAECVIGRGAYIGAGVRLGDRVKVQNLAQVYEPAVVEDGVFIGPGAVLTNDEYPRAIRPDGSPSRRRPLGAGRCHRAPWLLGRRPGRLRRAGRRSGRWAMVAAGAVVVHDVPDFALVAGTPARRIGWVGTGRASAARRGRRALALPRHRRVVHRVRGSPARGWGP